MGGMFDDVINKVGEPYTGGGKGFTYGTHEVVIGTAEAKSKDTKKAKDCAIIEVVVFDPADNDRTANCTLWFHTPGAAKMSVTKILGLLVHNVGEEKKEKVREIGQKMFGAIDDPIKARDVANKLINDKLLTKKGYIVAEPSGTYKTTSYADLWHYPATPQDDPVDDTEKAAQDVGGSVVEDEDIPDDL